MYHTQKTHKSATTSIYAHTYSKTLGHVAAHIVTHTEEYVVATTYTQNAVDLQSTSPTCVFTLLFIEGYGSVHRHMFRHSTCGVTSPYACKMPKIVTLSLSIDALIAPATPLHLHQKQHTSHTSLSSQPTHRHSTTLCLPQNTQQSRLRNFVLFDERLSPTCQSKMYRNLQSVFWGREMCMQYTKSMNTRNIQTYKTQIHMHIYLYLCVHTYNKHQESRGLQRQTSLRGSLRTKSKKHTYNYSHSFPWMYTMYTWYCQMKQLRRMRSSPWTQMYVRTYRW